MKKYIFIVSLLFLVGCSRPEIIINSPTEGQSYVTEAYIHINATINDPDGIKRVSYTIYNITYDFFLTGAPTTYDLSDTQSMYNFPSGYEVEIKIEAEDELTNIGTKIVVVKHS